MCVICYYRYYNLCQERQDVKLIPQNLIETPTTTIKTNLLLLEVFILTMHSKNIAGLGPMAWWLPLPTLDEGWQTGSPLVPDKLPRLLPHKGRVPGRSRDSPKLDSVAHRPTVGPPGREGSPYAWLSLSSPGVRLMQVTYDELYYSSMSPFIMH